MRVAVLGAGPAGLYFAYLLRRSHLGAEIDVFEQNPADATFGFGVVFSQRALDFLKQDDAPTHDAILPHMEQWQDLTIAHRGKVTPIDGIGFTAIGRLELLRLFQDRARSVGIEPHYNSPIDRLDALDQYDLVVGADGVNSLVRNSLAQEFGATISTLGNKFIWYGTKKPYDALTQTFLETEHGAVTAHHYRFKPDMSTFIIEMGGETWERSGFAQMGETETIERCQEIFAEQLDGHKLITNNSHWRNFPKISTATWSVGKYVLVGDALRTAHYSIGSGTRLAMEDGIALVRALFDHRGEHPNEIRVALQAYEAARRPVVETLVTAANMSADWYERMDELISLDPYDFAYSYIQRSGRVAAESLDKLSPKFMAAYRANTAH